MKRILVVLMVLSLFVTGCSPTSKTIDLTETPAISTEETMVTEAPQSVEPEKPVLFDKDVEIILSMVSFDNSQTIEDYVANLQKENPDSVFAVYDDSHYIQTIKESKRKETVELMKTEEEISASFQEFFSDEQYKGAFISMEYDDLFQNITFYADKTAYESIGLFAVFGPVLVSSIWGDMVQAYNLVPVGERYVTVQIVDKQTGEVIYDSSAE